VHDLNEREVVWLNKRTESRKDVVRSARPPPLTDRSERVRKRGELSSSCLTHTHSFSSVLFFFVCPSRFSWQVKFSGNAEREGERRTTTEEGNDMAMKTKSPDGVPLRETSL
jgi:hypothetical protein